MQLRIKIFNPLIKLRRHGYMQNNNVLSNGFMLQWPK